MSTGRRIARSIKKAIKNDCLEQTLKLIDVKDEWPIHQSFQANVESVFVKKVSKYI